MEWFHKFTIKYLYLGYLKLMFLQNLLIGKFYKIYFFFLIKSKTYFRGFVDLSPNPEFFVFQSSSNIQQSVDF